MKTLYEIMDDLAAFAEELGADVGKCPGKEGTCAFYIYAKDRGKELYIDKDYNGKELRLTIRYQEKFTLGSWEVVQKIMLLKDGKPSETKAIIKTFIKENYV